MFSQQIIFWSCIVGVIGGPYIQYVYYHERGEKNTFATWFLSFIFGTIGAWTGNAAASSPPFIGEFAIVPAILGTIFITWLWNVVASKAKE
jgi:uncharacterized membrane protein YeaQ/YmgE (transglycosylase-associated protein family)